jgi:Nuclear transport factor 2 (NTF2) domain
LQAISEKIKSMDIQDCKVRVLNVDSQASFQNIVVQVIGEMSNKSEPHHKFVQTFVLAEQPNGYFVLNDIFRYLNSDEDEIVEDEPVEEEVPQEEHVSPVVPAAVPEVEKATEVVDTEEAIKHVDTELEDVAKAQDEEPLTNGTESPAVEEAQEEAHATTELSEAPAEEPVEPVTEKPVAPEPTRAPSPPEAPIPAPAVEAAPVRKTWASMVGTKAPAVPAVPVAVPAAPSQPKSQKISQPAQQPTTQAVPAEPAADSDSSPQSNGWQMADHGKKQKGAQAVTATVGNTLAYVKNVTEKVDAFLLKETLEKYGKLKYYDVARARVSHFTTSYGHH